MAWRRAVLSRVKSWKTPAVPLVVARATRSSSDTCSSTKRVIARRASAMLPGAVCRSSTASTKKRPRGVGVPGPAPGPARRRVRAGPPPPLGGPAGPPRRSARASAASRPPGPRTRPGRSRRRTGRPCRSPPRRSGRARCGRPGRVAVAPGRCAGRGSAWGTAAAAAAASEAQKRGHLRLRRLRDRLLRERGHDGVAARVRVQAVVVELGAEEAVRVGRGREVVEVDVAVLRRVRRPATG